MRQYVEPFDRFTEVFNNGLIEYRQFVLELI